MPSSSVTNSRREFLSDSAGLLVAGGIPLTLHAMPQESAGPRRSASASSIHRIIIDTDPGVDDALAILLALRSLELKVEAITAVAGNVPLELTLANALRLVEIAGRTDVPVAAGASSPLERRLVIADYFHGENGLAGVEFPKPVTRPVAESASEIIRRIVRGSPGEISIVAIGPLTNVATALRADRTLAAAIRSIVLMGGSLSGGNVTPSAEFNIYADPEAARIVFDAGIRLTMVGLDVTRKVLLREDHIRALEAGKNAASQAAGRIMRRTLDRAIKEREATDIPMHDPLTVAHVIDPEILKLKDYFIAVETSGEMTAGETVGYAQGPIFKSAPLKAGAMTAPSRDAAFRPNAKVAIGVEPERFFHLFLERLAGST